MKFRVGDIFTIQVSEDKIGFGQIIEIPNKDNFIIAVYKTIYTGKDWPSLQEIVEDEVLLLGYTLDAKLYHKHWKIIGNLSLPPGKVKLPFFRLGTAPDYKLVDYKGQVIKNIGLELFNCLNYQTVIAPVRYENALKAYHGLNEWRAEYDDLMYTRTLESIEHVKKSV